MTKFLHTHASWMIPLLVLALMWGGSMEWRASATTDDVGDLQDDMKFQRDLTARIDERLRAIQESVNEIKSRLTGRNR